jgi:hypothetical protein
VPFIALRIVLLEIVPLRPRFHHFEADVARDRAKTVGIKSPAVDGEAVLRAAGWRDDATEPMRLQDAGDFEHRFPEKFRMLKSLPGNEHIDSARLKLAPIVRIAQDKVDIVSRREIGPEIKPRRLIEKRAVRAINVVAAKIDNEKWLVPSRLEVIAAEGRHFVEGAWMHLAPPAYPALKKSQPASLAHLALGLDFAW